jgi:hypothetical protein
MLPILDLDMEGQKKKKKFSEEEIHSQQEVQEQSPRPGGIKVLKKKQLIMKKRTRVKLPKLCKEACPECGDLNISLMAL